MPPRGGATPRFVIQEHHARALHWDLRLERDGVLASWALPKGLPDDPKRNHLAVHTEDHPIEYATFSGDIPAGEYGAGTMAIWDSGTYETEKWSDTEVKFVLHGTRASGDFVLFQTDGKNWMIHRHGESVLTDPIPTSIKPMLAVLGTLPEGRSTWAYEVKWDGARTLAFVDGGRVRLQSRSERDVTAMFPELAGMGEHLGMHAVVLDGEVVAFGDDGRPSFARLQNRLHLSDPKEARRRAAADPVHFVAFDVLYADGRSLMADPYDTRRARLEQFEFSGANFTTTECFRDVSGRDVLRATTENGLEGVVAKRRNSTYRPGRRVAEWVKVKVVNTQEVVIGGWTDGKGGRGASLGSLLLGIPGSNGLDYVGKVGTGFDDRALQSIMEQLRALRSRTNPFVGTITEAEAKGAHFVRPSLVGEVGYGEWTPAGRLRHPTWRGLRPDKTPADVGRESEPSTSAPGDDVPAPMRTRSHRHRSQERLAARACRRSRAFGDEPGQGAVPRDRVHQRTVDRLLRPHRPGHAPAPLGSAPHHEALSRRGRGQVLLREARALAHPPLGEDGEGPLRAPGRDQLRRRPGPAHPDLGGQPGHH